jgi:hypothetical protein
MSKEAYRDGGQIAEYDETNGDEEHLHKSGTAFSIEGRVRSAVIQASAAGSLLPGSAIRQCVSDAVPGQRRLAPAPGLITNGRSKLSWISAATV